MISSELGVAPTKLAALQFMAVMVGNGRTASKLSHVFEPVPQVLRNVFCPHGIDVLSTAKVHATIREAVARLAGRGRLVVRRSGTEPLVRVMAKSDDDGLMTEVVDTIVDQLSRAST